MIGIDSIIQLLSLAPSSVSRLFSLGHLTFFRPQIMPSSPVSCLSFLFVFQSIAQLNSMIASMKTKSLAGQSFKSSVDQGIAETQFNHGVMLEYGQGISMNRPFAAHYSKLSAD
jgi:TPR repeat protein